MSPTVCIFDSQQKSSTFLKNNLTDPNENRNGLGIATNLNFRTIRMDKCYKFESFYLR